MKKLFVDLAEKSYNIYFDVDFNKLCDKISEVGQYKKVLIVTDTNVERLYGAEAVRVFTANGYDTEITRFEAGEQSKSIDTIMSICAACIEHGMDRKSLIVALGGGVVGDMAGFAAAIYMRGIDFVQVPTTLLSQSDSSVGGKTGIDFMNAKNILGAFHQPKLVYINTSTLKTLPEREFVSGMGEVIKHGMIRNRAFFDSLVKNHDSIAALDNSVLLDIAYTNCSIKADVVSKDEFENGLRADLNFGHTIGHAVEAYSGFRLTHGECVGMGMLAAAHIANKRGIFSDQELKGLENVLKMYGFSLKTEISDRGAVKDIMQRDKKKSAGSLKFVLPEKIGSVFQCTDVTEKEIDEALDFIGK